MPTPKNVRLIAVGDIMLGDHPVCIGHGVRSRMEKKGMHYPFKLVSSFLNKGDITFGNLEVVLSDLGFDSARLDKAELRGRPSYCIALSEAGFTVLSLANNHTMQHGTEAFKETVKLLQEKGIFCVGLDEGNRKSNLFVFQKNDISIALIAYSLRPEKYYNGPVFYAVGNEWEIIPHIKMLSVKYDAVVVSLHWGEEYLNYPSYEQIILGHKIIDAGANLILGHHPHVLQGCEKYKEGFIAYSLGNFVFDKWERNPRESIILDCSIGKDGIRKITWLPVIINRQYQPQIIRGVKAQQLERKIRGYSSWIESVDLSELKSNMPKYKKAVSKAYFKFRLSSYSYFLRHFYRYPPKMLKQSLFRFFQRRLSG